MDLKTPAKEIFTFFAIGESLKLYSVIKFISPLLYADWQKYGISCVVYTSLFVTIEYLITIETVSLRKPPSIACKYNFFNNFNIVCILNSVYCECGMNVCGAVGYGVSLVILRLWVRVPLLEKKW